MKLKMKIKQPFWLLWLKMTKKKKRKRYQMKSKIRFPMDKNL